MEENRRAVSVLYIDSDKAFYSVSNDILIDKMTNHRLNRWRATEIENWLSSWVQKVTISGMKSSWSQITSSVPQGLVPQYCLMPSLMNWTVGQTEPPASPQMIKKVWEVADTTKDLLFGGILTGWRIDLRGFPWCSTRGNAKSWTRRIIIPGTHIKPPGKYLVRERPQSRGKQEGDRGVPLQQRRLTV